MGPELAAAGTAVREPRAMSVEDRLRMTGSGEVVDVFRCFEELVVGKQLMESDRQRVSVPDRFGGETDGNAITDGAKDERLSFRGREPAALAVAGLTGEEPTLDRLGNGAQQGCLGGQPQEEDALVPHADLTQASVRLEERPSSR